MKRYRTVELAAAAKDWAAVGRMINAPRFTPARLPKGSREILAGMPDGGTVPAELYPAGWLTRADELDAGAPRTDYGSFETARASRVETVPAWRAQTLREAPAPRKGSVSLEALLEVLEADDGRGFCITCGDEAYNVEPDTRRSVCESCGDRAVYGAQELMIMGAAS